MIVISWAITGLILGLMARLIKRGNTVGGWIAGPLIGLCFAILFGWLGALLLGVNFENALDPIGLLIAAAGAVFALLIWELTTRKRL